MTHLKEIRLKNNITQSDLANKTSLSLGMVKHYEQGSKNIDGAKVDTLINIAEALNCKVWDIVESDELREKLKRHCE